MGQIARETHRFGHGASSHDSSEQSAAIQIARSVQHIGHEFIRGLEHLEIATGDKIANEAVASLNAFQNDVFRALFQKGGWK